MPKTSVHLLSRKESERRRAGWNPPPPLLENGSVWVDACVRACVCVYTRGKVAYEIKSFAALTTDGQRGSTLGVRATIRGRDEIESAPRSPSLFAIKTMAHEKKNLSSIRPNR
ncbi:hypothetical protein ALC62_10622 [Cyphomyrmex costatus]|uniref:Uncharacterized protein n=1 Tax=Cyphomyrmex costatus TaxID=456900 RepID=A0A195CCR8_9HYME|nr:hypothetical protein ALC62_10622 [Cyphomyrmex costatus]